MARTKQAENLFWACLFHCASVPPVIMNRHEKQTGYRTFQGSVSGGSVGFLMGSSGKSERISKMFSGVQSSNYWSSTTNANNTSNAWNVNLNNGNVNNNDKSNNNYVWPVRGGE